MKKITLLFAMLFAFQFSYAQSETSLIEKTLKNYMDGSSYNKPEMLLSAFTENATLYLTGKNGFKLYSPTEYVGFFKNSKKGVFNGRDAKIFAIEVSDAGRSGWDSLWFYIIFNMKSKIITYLMMNNRFWIFSELNIRHILHITDFILLLH